MRDPFRASQKRLEESETDDPILSPDDWYPEFRAFHHQVIRETPDFDYLALKERQRDLYDAIKAKEKELDSLGPAPLSRVMEIMRDWRALILEAEAERRKVRGDDDRARI
jgi:hypothetical protein